DRLRVVDRLLLVREHDAEHVPPSIPRALLLSHLLDQREDLLAGRRRLRRVERRRRDAAVHQPPRRPRAARGGPLELRVHAPERGREAPLHLADRDLVRDRQEEHSVRSDPQVLGSDRRVVLQLEVLPAHVLLDLLVLGARHDAAPRTGAVAGVVVVLRREERDAEGGELLDRRVLVVRTDHLVVRPFAVHVDGDEHDLPVPLRLLERRRGRGAPLDVRGRGDTGGREEGGEGEQEQGGTRDQGGPPRTRRAARRTSQRERTIPRFLPTFPPPRGGRVDLAAAAGRRGTVYSTRSATSVPIGRVRIAFTTRPSESVQVSTSIDPPGVS